MPTTLRTMGRLVLSGALAMTLASASGCGLKEVGPSRGARTVRNEPTSARAYASDEGGDPVAGSAGASQAAPRSMREPSPDERPGLGTEWGETRFSQVRDVAFVRGSGDRPFAVEALHYNDRKGVNALARRERNRGALPVRDDHDDDGDDAAVTVSLRGEDGERLDAVGVGDRTFVIGEPGERYSIVLTNRTSQRIEAVTTVDGLDVINGQPGSMGNRGYLLMPYGSVEIDGFRRSERAVAAFRFAGVGESYAAQMGTARNVGVIGVALFSERGEARLPARARALALEREARLREAASPFPGGYARAPRR